MDRRPHVADSSTSTRLQDLNLAELLQWAPRVLEKLRTLRQLRDVNTDQRTAGLQLFVDVDHDTASRLGISPSVVDSTLYDAYGQRQVTTTYTQVNQYRCWACSTRASSTR
jgi:multidrug efflux pump subunit AcrB